MDALNFEVKPYVGILSSYYIISSYRQHMFILSIMGLHGTNPRELPEKIMSHCFLYIPLFDNLTLSVLIHDSPQIITVECVKYHMGILYFSVVVIHYLMFVPF